RFLHWIELTMRRQPLDGDDVRAIGLHAEHAAAFDGFAVQLHGARATEQSFAAHVRTRQARNVAQEMNQQQTRLDLLGITLPVDRKTDVHGVLRRDEFKRCRTYQNSGLSAPIIRLILAAGASGFCRLTFAMLTGRETRVSD